MAQMCASAVQAGVTEIAFSDHFNNHLLDIDLGYYNADRYFSEVERCRAKFPTLTIRTAIELGEPHRWGRKIQPVLDRYPYDIVLGSLHWVGNNNLFNINYYRGNPAPVTYGAYFAELAQMAKNGGFNILAHVDLPKRVSCGVYGPFDSKPYEDLIRATWQACIENEIAVELNTKGLRSGAAEIHPSLDALRWYAEMGGRLLTFGSDAHREENIADSFDLAREYTLSAGLTHICRFEQRAVIGWSEV